MIADLHVHSRFAMATSNSLTTTSMIDAAVEKGIDVISTGDILHKDWLAEVESTTEEVDSTGLYRLKSRKDGPLFILGAEISTVFYENGKTRKVHNCVLLPSIESVKSLRDRLSKYGKLDSDGRPTLMMSAASLVDELFSVEKNAFVFPAHLWTPYFGALGSISGFDSVKEAYADQEKHIHAIETGLSCYDYKTEVLTENGWKKFEQINHNDKICTLNPSNNVVEFHNPTKIWKSNYKGKMYKLKTKRVDIFVTPNHRLFYTPFASHNSKKFYLKEAEELFGKSKTFKKDGEWISQDPDYFELPGVKIRHGSKYYSGLRYKKKRLLPLDSWLKFLGFWIAEGHSTSSIKYGSYEVVVSNTNKSILVEMKDLLKNMGFNPFLSTKGACPQLRVRDYQLYHYLSKIGKSYNKYIPKEIKALSKKSLRLLFDYYIKGDGHIYGRNGKGLSATTNSVKLRDDLQEIALKLGMSAYYKLTSPKGTPLMSLNKPQYKSTHDAWTVFFIRRNLHGITPSTIKKYNYTEEWVDFEGLVYCVTVPNHIIYVRRNGIPVWCGNSDPQMNWIVSGLDKYALVSNSDMHSTMNMGREANVLNIDRKNLTYSAITNAIKDKDSKRLSSTIEFYPEEGKYHFDGHRDCHFSTDPSKTDIKNCRICGKPLVMGVMHRVMDLADRPADYHPKSAVPYVHIVPLMEVISYSLKKGKYSKPVRSMYDSLVKEFSTEFNILIDADINKIAEKSSEEIAEAIRNVREGKVHITPGYAGVFGKLDLLPERASEPSTNNRQKGLSDF